MEGNKDIASSTRTSDTTVIERTNTHKQPGESKITDSKLIRENTSSNGNFAARSEKFGNIYSQERAYAAFNDYKKQRESGNNRSKENKHKVLLSRPTEPPRVKSKEFVESRGSEVFFACKDVQEGMERVMELIGPVPPERRNITYFRLGEKFKSLREQGKPTPTNGFSTAMPLSEKEDRFVWHKSWRLDFSEQEGCHFNVIIRPPIIQADTQIGNYGSGYPESLNIAFLFPGSEEDYETLIVKIYDNFIAGMYEEDDVKKNINYLPKI